VRKRLERGLRALNAYRKARDAGKLPVLENRTIEPIPAHSPPEAVRVSRRPKQQNDGFPPFSIVREINPHIANHGDSHGDKGVDSSRLVATELGQAARSLAYAQTLSHGRGQETA
jgi:hypothetical protein